MKLKPLNDRLVVKREKAEEKAPSGIIIPDAAKKKPTRGEVLAVGPGKALENGSRRPLDVKPGDVVLFDKFAGTEMKLDGEEVLLLSESDVFGVVETEGGN